MLDINWEIRYNYTMNQRIKQIALQSQKVVGYTDGGYTEILALDQEKFAQLIIEECHDIMVIGGVDDIDAVYSHFGLED